jgi:hypothetical protein
MMAYREAHGLQATADHFGVSRQRVCQLLPGMGKPRGTFTGRKPLGRGLDGPLSIRKAA